MKKLAVVLAVSILACSCTAEREIQADIIYVELVKIDTVMRHPDLGKRILTWRSERNIDYVTVEPKGSLYIIGSKMKMIVRR